MSYFVAERRATGGSANYSPFDYVVERMVWVPVRYSNYADFLGRACAAEFGEPPQEALNRQIVDKCDICIAIFRARLGTRTKGAESGTAEEIERLSGAGKYVAVLRCQRKVDLQDIDLNQLADLDRYLLQLKDKALIINYKNDAELAQKVQNILNISVDHMQSVKGA